MKHTHIYQVAHHFKLKLKEKDRGEDNSIPTNTQLQITNYQKKINFLSIHFVHKISLTYAPNHQTSSETL